MRSRRGTRGPALTSNARAGIGFSSPQAQPLRADPGDGEMIVELNAAGLAGHRVRSGEELRYDWFPEAGPALAQRWEATAFALDVEFEDGTLLSAAGCRDQHGTPLDPGAQAAAKTLWAQQWNRRTVALGPVEGRRVRRVLARLHRGRDRAVSGWLDGVGIAPAPAMPGEPLGWVRTTRGSQSSADFSRGNTAPLVAVPHGGVFGLPMTDASAGNWPYAYHHHNRDDGRPALQAFATSHLPSPWIGDRGVFQLMPSPLRDPDPRREARALGFYHEHEQDGPHEYAVTLDGGIRARMTAGDHALALRFESSGPWLSIVLDHLGELAGFRVRHGEDALEAELELDDGPGRPRHFLFLRLPPGGADRLVHARGRLRGGICYRTPGGGRVDALVGISTIDAAHARANLQRSGGFDAQLAEATRRWRAALSVLQIEGATADQARAIHSDLYRLFLYPNRYSEPGEGARPEYRSPVDGALRSGVFSATTGFWDSYRTCWPALALLTPRTAGELAQGFVQHFTDSGWTSRWSAPGPVDSMTGTSSDIVFAELCAAEVPGLDRAEAYRSALMNATVAPIRPEVGRKGLFPGLWRGYISSETHEGLSWTLDNAINDWGASVLAAQLADAERDRASRERLRTEAEYLARRSLGYRAVFHPGLGFFLGRRADGAWRIEPEAYDPEVWGHDYTETNGWGTAYTVPHDGRGLAALHGGEAALGASLDRFFSTPETADPAKAGSYGFVIHEQAEARDVRMGMLGLSNQPAHHIPFMYMFAGRHDDAHRIVTEARDRLFVGSEVGQGFPGDEDNGEMSGWHLFACLGLYPLVPASDAFVLTPPLLPQAVLRPEGGAELTIRASDPGAPYIKRVRFRGREWRAVSIPRSLLREGGLLEFELSREPLGWAADSRPVSASELHGFTAAPADLLRCEPGGPADDLGRAPLSLEPDGEVTLPLRDAALPGGLYTVTLAAPALAAWRLYGLTASGAAVHLDRRAAEPFERPWQLRPFRLRPAVADERIVAVRFVAEAPLQLVQLELLDEGRA